MSSIIKTILILIVLAGIGYGIYFYFSKQDTAVPVSNTASAPIAPVASTTSQNTNTSSASTTTNSTMSEQDFLTILLSVRKINLNQEIFKEPAFGTLQNSTIELVPDGNEGRPNPFAPIGTDPIAPATVTNTATDTNISIPNISIDSSGGTSVDFVLPTQNTITPTSTPVIVPKTQTPVSNITITPNKGN
jgi:hypothetical protein